MNFNIIICLIFLGLNITIIPALSEAGEDNTSDSDEKGYHSETDRHSSHIIQKKQTRTTPRKSFRNEKKRRSLSFLRDNNGDKDKLVISSPIQPIQAKEKNTSLNNHDEYHTAIKYVLGESNGRREQFIALSLLGKNLHNERNIDRKSKQEIQSKIKKYTISYYTSKVRAYTESSNQHTILAATFNEMEKVRNLQIAQQKIEKAEKYIKLKMHLLKQSYEDSQEFQEIIKIKEKLKHDIQLIPVYNNGQIALEEARKKENKAKQHLKLAKLTKESITKISTSKEHHEEKKKGNTVTLGLLHMLGKKKKNLADIKEKNARKRSVTMLLTEGMRSDSQEKLKNAQERELAQAQHLLLESVNSCLTSHEYTPKKEKLRKAQVMIETAEEIEEERTIIAPTLKNRKSEIQRLKKRISEKEKDLSEESSSSETISEENTY